MKVRKVRDLIRELIELSMNSEVIIIPNKLAIGVRRYPKREKEEEEYLLIFLPEWREKK